MAEPIENEVVDTNTEPEPEQPEQTPVVFGDLLKDKSFQSELGRYVNKALDTAKAKWEKDAQERISKAKTEGEKLAKMSAEERAKAEAEQRVAEILAREEQMNEREAVIMRRELRATALDALEQRGLPAVLADVLNYESAEACNTSIEALEKAFRPAVQTGVDERMKPNLPPKAGGNDAAAAHAAMRAAIGLPPK